MATIDLDLWLATRCPIQKLWAIVVLVALKDRASRVDYDPARGDKALTYDVDSVEYEMVTPPQHLAREIERLMRETLQPPPLWRRLFGSWIAPIPICNRTAHLKLGTAKGMIEGTTDPVRTTVCLTFTVNDPMAEAAKTALDAFRLTRGDREL